MRSGERGGAEAFYEELGQGPPASITWTGIIADRTWQLALLRTGSELESDLAVRHDPRPASLPVRTRRQRYAPGAMPAVPM